VTALLCPVISARAPCRGAGAGGQLSGSAELPLLGRRPMPQEMALSFARARSNPGEIDEAALDFGRGPRSKLGTAAALGKPPVRRERNPGARLVGA